MSPNAAARQRLGLSFRASSGHQVGAHSSLEPRSSHCCEPPSSRGLTMRVATYPERPEAVSQDCGHPSPPIRA